MLKRCVIVGGAEIKDYGRIKKYLKSGDFMIFCDCGLRHKEPLGVEVDLIVGDFDSFERPSSGTETIVLPCEKDDTDTAFAVKTALSRGFDEFLLIGVVGGRLDHTLGNLYLLLMLDEAGKKALIADDFSEMEIVGESGAKVCDSFSYFSLISIAGNAEGVTITGAKYPLDGAVITCGYQYGVSNEVLPRRTAEISVKKGKLLLIRVF